MQLPQLTFLHYQESASKDNAAPGTSMLVQVCLPLMLAGSPGAQRTGIGKTQGRYAVDAHFDTTMNLALKVQFVRQRSANSLLGGACEPLFLCSTQTSKKQAIRQIELHQIAVQVLKSRSGSRLACCAARFDLLTRRCFKPVPATFIHSITHRIK